ncbi:hypothetical protein [Ruminococcus flavefaciens]|uniref:hypothetical protein n=1 Tax=Ruminococcus flavefaciens TaxID=1265 RepID=UPI00037553B9|nr:hypothetical protein [Ruminococcus flavefaciens]
MLFYNHILLEAYCTKNDKDKCKLKKKKICIECFAEQCEYLSYTEAPSEIMISDKNGISIFDIGFGGDMETTEAERDNNIHIWENICKTKIEEAYSEYMKQKNK